MTPPAATPVVAGDLVGAVLARDTALIDVFVRHSPHFEKLRNPVLRRMMARLVTVEQAAGVAGVAADLLVRDLNAALGVDTAAAHEQPVPCDVPSGSAPAAREAPPGRLREVELDLREDLRLGREPFARIMAAVGALGDDQVLHLRAIFEPVPLYAVLGRRGLAHASRARAAGDWSVWFWREGDVAMEAAPVASTAPARGERWLDVRGLEPPEPMVRTLAALEALAPGELLVQVNVRVPQFLLPILAERGFVAEVDETQPDRVLVRIRHG